jgi:hypothetical protein
MPLNFNVDPYYDDFDPAKNFHRILFKPGFAVQARELTQSQSILQDQITKFADNIFKQNSPVTGGQVTTNFNCSYIKLQPTYNDAAIDVNAFINKLVRNATGTVLAQVISVVAATGTTGAGDPPTLIISYKSGDQFQDDDIVFDVTSNLAAQAQALDATGLSSVASIAQGVFYVSSNYTRSDGITISDGLFVQVNPQTVVVDKYDNTPTKRIGLNITETITDYVNDTSLLDPAVGASNYQAPGADRYKVSLALESRPITFGDDDGFIELVRVEDGNTVKLVDGSVYGVIDDYFAKRDYETNGDYVVSDFKLTPKTNPLDSDTYVMNVGKGLAYVHGYRLENLTSVDLVSDRARTSDSQNNNPVFINFGSYFYVDNVNGSNTAFFDTTSYSPVDLHCVDAGNVSYANSNTYNATVVASANVRSLIYDSATGSTSNTYVYKAYVADVLNTTQVAFAVGGTASTITLPNYFSRTNDAYLGVNITISSGPSAGDFRTITAYNGTTKVATVNQNWTTTPTTATQFTLNFDTKDIESIIYASKASYPATLYAKADIDAEQGKVGGIESGDTILQNPNVPELVFTIGNPYVETITDTSYTTQQVWRNVSFTPSGGSFVATLPYTGDYNGVIRHFGTPSSTLSAELVRQNFTIVVTNKGSSTLNVGDNVIWTSAGRTITLNAGATTATMSATDVGGTFTATVYAKVFVENAQDTGRILKNKFLIQADTEAISTSNTQIQTYTFVDDTNLTSTGQIYIEKPGLVAPGNPQSLYLSDVKQIVKIIDTKNPSVRATVGMITNPAFDITSSYNFDNGQRDSYYDHASITLKPGAVQPIGNILVLVDYYQHSGGDGYFSILSYTNEQYQQIPQYTSTYGTTYSLRDSIDFRPTRVNATTNFEFRYSNSDTNRGIFLPVDLTTFLGDYSFYLGRKDKLVLSKDRSFQIVEGAPSLNPIYPTEPDGALVIAQLIHNPYTGYIPTESPPGTIADLSIQKVKHKRYTMQDIAGLENRINQVEYYTSLNLLEQKASSLQITDAFGLNRFKNGIVVDDFSSYATADTQNLDYFATINRRERKMTATQNVRNFPLKSLALAYNMNMPSESTSAALGYNISTDSYINYFTLPYSTSNVITQRIASRTVNVNPFAFNTKEGVVSLSPNVDNWVDTNYAPALLITDPNLQVYRANQGQINVLSAGDWQSVSGTSFSSTQWGRNWNLTTTTTTRNFAASDILGPYDRIGNTYALDNGYITDISVLPYIRSQEVVVRTKGLLINTLVTGQFDNIDVTNYIRKGNLIELTGVSGTFNENDIIGYFASGVFTPTARVLGTYRYPGTNNVRLYVAGDATSAFYSNSTTLQNGFYNTAGVYQNSTAQGTIASTSHLGGRLVNYESANKIRLAALSSTTNNFYTGNTIYINAGTGAGQSATISAYYGANQTALLASTVTAANGDIYSIGTLRTDESGSLYGVFIIPENTFHTGERVLNINNGINGNLDTATTYAEGTYYAQGLQTTSQRVDFGASPSGAKGTFTSTRTASTTTISTIFNQWDPVAQTFIISKDNYPNGIFIDSIKIFLRNKPQNDSSPISLYIVGTLNGYPNGEVLDNSVVTLTPDQVVVSENPQYLDPTAYTEFKFSAPVYIQPGLLYSFIVKSNSNEYILWTAFNGDTAVASSTKNLPTDPTPSSITKVGGAPSVGALFISQNSQTWTADQNQSLMFVINRCVFNTSTSPTIQFVVPKKLPQRTLIDESVDYFLNANAIPDITNTVANTDILVDAFNVTTTDLVPTTTNINYSYNASLTNGTVTTTTPINPGKFATSASDNIYLNDGKGQRVLIANSTTSFSVLAQLSSNDNAVSPVISDAGLTAYAITWNVNNCELSNSLITIVNGGAGYNTSLTSVTVSAPTGDGGVQATAAANISGGVIQSVYLVNPGSGYITTPTVSIADANSAPGTGASVTITGETSPAGGPGLAKYLTKKVVLDAGFDSGDLIVYTTAYRPVNTNILVYYKILNRNDTQLLDDSSWQLMTMINNSESTYSQTRDEYYEYSFAPGSANVGQGYVEYTSRNGQTYTTFSQFAIKIVLTSTDNTAVPSLIDMRSIALPPNVNVTL